MSFILAEKIKMTQLPDENVGAIPVTVVEAGPMVIAQIKTKETDGYNAIVCGFKTRKSLTKPVMSSLKKHLGEKVQTFRYLREFLVDDVTKFNIGDEITAETFSEGDTIKVQGVTKSKGFQGVVKRHHFHGASKTHGTKHALREPGSIGHTGIQRVAKGKKMAGRTGGETHSMISAKIVKVDKKNHLLFVRGSIPGRCGTLLKIISK
ncbi:MAG TPA: 50S ribosomal protein L3 [Candidatus Paceibacterota bacterium]|nr:50S ribosomal protein L3 [Candidatus Paceibacterota bacterium]HRZ29832.1 50S ribosomal protein L3 [Candidatus Paceibacterota bacterium]